AFVGFERRRVEQILVAGVEGASRRLRISIQSLAQDGDRVAVIFSDGSSGSYDLVVGADGISSTVRSLALGTRLPAYTGAMAWRSLAPIGLTTLQFHLGEGCFFGLCPVGDGRTYGFGNIGQPRETASAGELGARAKRCRRAELSPPGCRAQRRAPSAWRGDAPAPLRA